MRQWEIYKFPFPSENNPHYCVVLSPDSIANNPGYLEVNVFPCQTLRPAGRELKPNEVLLDQADGMEWSTVVKCQMIYAFPKSNASDQRGLVTVVRQAQIKNKLSRLFGLPIH